MKTMFCATVTKTTAASPLGLHLWAPPTTTGSGVLLVRLDDHGLFSGKLKAGLEIVRINDTSVTDMAIADVQDLLEHLVGRVTIWAAAPQPFAPSSTSRTVAPSDVETIMTIPKSKCTTTKSMSPPPSVTDLSDDTDNDSLSLECLSLDSLSLSGDNDDKEVCDMDFAYYYDEEPKQQPPQKYRVGPLFDAVMDFLF